MGREGTILKLNPYDLHGVRYYQMFIGFDDAPDRVQEVRLPHDNVYPRLRRATGWRWRCC